MISGSSSLKKGLISDSCSSVEGNVGFSWFLSS